ncbi:hypothetical protein N6H13_13885 [Paenibacillus sp. CC-CFT742]|nr:hypothetical protein [Paenibacillus sp. CC-CFT742]WJH31522.1 hypothetical protein N6H13_13885 [Paenibacillus sp. CC-CFT742]
MDRRGCRRRRHAPARPRLRRGAGAAGAAGQAPATPELAALLPGVPVAAGLTMIRERVAARIWQAVQKKKDSPATKS